MLAVDNAIGYVHLCYMDWEMCSLPFLLPRILPSDRFKRFEGLLATIRHSFSFLSGVLWKHGGKEPPPWGASGKSVKCVGSLQQLECLACGSPTISLLGQPSITSTGWRPSPVYSAFCRSVLNCPPEFCSSGVTHQQPGKVTGYQCLNPTTLRIFSGTSFPGTGSRASLGRCYQSFQMNVRPLPVSLPLSSCWICKAVFLYATSTHVYPLMCKIS